MSEKVKVSREVADALEKLINNALVIFHGEQKTIENAITELIIRNSLGSTYHGECSVLNNLSTYEFSKILIVGYEVEQTPEEKLLSWYQEQNNIWGFHLDGEVEARVTVQAIEKTLDILGIKIKGINEQK